jgi:hypothetical protein
LLLSLLPQGDVLTFSAPLLVCILHVVFELLQATSRLKPLKTFKETHHNAQIVWLNAKMPNQGAGCPTLLIGSHQ